MSRFQGVKIFQDKAGKCFQKRQKYKYKLIRTKVVIVTCDISHKALMQKTAKKLRTLSV